MDSDKSKLVKFMSHLRKMRFDDIYVSDDPENDSMESICELKGTGGIDDIESIPDDVAQILRPAMFKACSEREKRLENPDFAIDFEGMRFRVSRMPALMGSVYVMRKFPESVPSIHDLGFEPWILSRLLKPNLRGVIVVAGATGSGKTTSVSALVKEIITTRGGLCVTIEDPCEMPLHGKHGKGRCYQVEVINGDFATPSKMVLRWHPDYIYFGEVRDSVSASKALESGINGHLVLCTIHADSPGSAVERLHTMATTQDRSTEDAASLLANGLVAVVHQEMKTVLGKRKVERQFLWLGEEGENVKPLIKERKFNLLPAQVIAQGHRFNPRK